MGLSFHDDTTMAVSSAGTRLRFGSGDADSTLEAGKVVNEEPESGYDTIDFKGGNYINETEK